MNFRKIFIIAFLVMMLVISIPACSKESDTKPTEGPTPTGTQGLTPSPTIAPTPGPDSLLKLVSIPAGEFSMGSRYDDSRPNESPVHEVELSSFYMSQYEVNYGEWSRVKDWASNHSYVFTNMEQAGNYDLGDGYHPVTRINWYDAVKWCNALSELEGLEPCYYLSSDQNEIYRSGTIDVINDWVKWDADGYRLPTEAEWEYACRAGGSTKYSFGNQLKEAQANFFIQNGKTENGTTPVGSYPPNDWGLYDMHGNVWEWCWDLFVDAYYAESPSRNPHGPDIGNARVRRGGAWGSSTSNLRSTYRNGYSAVYLSAYLGFRVVRSK